MSLKLVCINRTIVKHLESGKRIPIDPGSKVCVIKKLRSKYLMMYEGNKVMIDESVLSNFR